MKNKFKLIPPAQNVADNKKSFESSEQDTLQLPIGHPTPQGLASMVPLSEAEPETFILPATQRARNTLFWKILAKLPVPLRQIVTRFFEQAEDPYPERTYVNPEVQTLTIIQWGWLPVLTLVCALGMFSIAYGFAAARDGQPGLEVTFIVGLLLMFVPAIVRQFSPDTPRFERIATVCVVGLCLYLISIMASPTHFSSYDEFLHWRTADDIAATGHLFTPNSLLPVSPYYPGLEIVTNALSMLSGLNSFYSALLVIGVARLLMVLALFLLNEQMTNSSRIASIATLIYMCNPHFLIFDVQYAYESLALPLATCVLFMVTPHQLISARLKSLEPISHIFVSSKGRLKQLINDLWRVTCITLIVIIALIFTHHVTDFFLVSTQLPERPVVLTFDDGFADFFTDALPILQQYRFGATLYISTAFVGQTSCWLRREGEQARTMLTWEQIRQVHNAGIECGGHTHQHVQLDTLPLSRANEEIGHCKDLLEQHLGQPVLTFAYPFGYYTASIRQCVRSAGYTLACAVGHRMSSERSDPLALTRFIVKPTTTLTDFQHLLNGIDLSILEATYLHTRTRLWQIVRRSSVFMRSHLVR